MKARGIFFAITSAVFFGLMPYFATMAYKDGSSTVTVLTWRFLVSGTCLFVFNLVTGRRMRIGFKRALMLMFLGGVGVGLTSYLLFESYRYICTGTSTTLHFIYPAAVTAGAVMFYREKLTLRKILALASGLTGMYLLTGGLGGEGLNITGCILAVTSGLTYTIYILGINNRLLKGTDAFVMTFYVSLSGFIAMALMGLNDGGIHMPGTTLTWGMVVLLGTVSTFASTLLFIKAVKIVGPSTTSILSLFEPLTSVMVGLIIMGEAFNPTGGAGMVLILLVPFLTV